MMILSLFAWWYSTGWAALGSRVEKRIEHTLQAFSIALLMRTLFAPFRQISANVGGRSFEAQMHALADRLFSRIFGAVVRSVCIFVGLLFALGIALIGFAQLVLWPLIPVLPVIGLIAMIMGWRL